MWVFECIGFAVVFILIRFGLTARTICTDSLRRSFFGIQLTFGSLRARTSTTNWEQNILYWKYFPRSPLRINIVSVKIYNFFETKIRQIKISPEQIALHWTHPSNLFWSNFFVYRVLLFLYLKKMQQLDSFKEDATGAKTHLKYALIFIFIRRLLSLVGFFWVKDDNGKWSCCSRLTVFIFHFFFFNFSEPFSSSNRGSSKRKHESKQRNTSTSSTMTNESYSISLGVGPLWWSWCPEPSQNRSR